MKVAVLGASPKEERYSNKALKMLAEYGHQVFAINPGYKEIDGKPVYATLKELPDKVDTITIYVSNPIDFLTAIKEARPRRVIFNPGTENPQAQSELAKAGIEVTEACTLVLLRTKQF